MSHFPTIYIYIYIERERERERDYVQGCQWSTIIIILINNDHNNQISYFNNKKIKEKNYNLFQNSNLGGTLKYKRMNNRRKLTMIQRTTLINIRTCYL